MDEEKKPRYLTVLQVANLLQVDETKVIEMIKAGALPAIELGDDVGFRIDEDDFQSFIQSKKTEVKATVGFNANEISREKSSLESVCNYLRAEKGELLNYYGMLSSAIEKAVTHLNEELDSARRGGDQARVKACSQGLKIIFNKWDKNRKAYSEVLFNSQSPLSSYRKDEIQLLLNGNPDSEDMIPAQYKQMQEERDLYRGLVSKLRVEVDDIIKYYRDLDKAVNKMIREFKSALKKSTKDLDFASSQLFSDVMTLLYREWETARQPYFHWLEGQEQRWQECRARVQSDNNGDTEI